MPNNSKFFKIRREAERLEKNKNCKVTLKIETDGFTVVTLSRVVTLDTECNTTLHDTFTVASGYPQDVYRRLYIINRAIEF